MRDLFRDLVEELQKVDNPKDKMEIVAKRFLAIYPFERASIFSYTPLSYVGEGVLMLDPSGVTPLDFIKEDVRNILPVYSVLQTPRAEYLPDASCKTGFPDKYVKEFEISSMVVVPIQQETSVIGCILTDRFKGGNTISYELLLSMRMFGKAVGQSIVTPLITQVLHGLSKRELEVMQRMSEGQSIKEMAYDMGISEFTVRDYISAAMKKLDVANRTQAVAKAIRMGIIC